MEPSSYVLIPEFDGVEANETPNIYYDHLVEFVNRSNIYNNNNNNPSHQNIKSNASTHQEKNHSSINTTTTTNTNNTNTNNTTAASLPTSTTSPTSTPSSTSPRAMATATATATAATNKKKKKKSNELWNELFAKDVTIPFQDYENRKAYMDHKHTDSLKVFHDLAAFDNVREHSSSKHHNKHETLSPHATTPATNTNTNINTTAAKKTTTSSSSSSSTTTTNNNNNRLSTNGNGHTNSNGNNSTNNRYNDYYDSIQSPNGKDGSHRHKQSSADVNYPDDDYISEDDEKNEMFGSSNFDLQQYVKIIKRKLKAVKQNFQSEKLVDALKLTVQCTLILLDERLHDNLHFFPVVYALVAKVLECFGECVYQRLLTIALSQVCQDDLYRNNRAQKAKSPQPLDLQAIVNTYALEDAKKQQQNQSERINVFKLFVDKKNHPGKSPTPNIDPSNSMHHYEIDQSLASTIIVNEEIENKDKIQNIHERVPKTLEEENDNDTDTEKKVEALDTEEIEELEEQEEDDNDDDNNEQEKKNINIMYTHMSDICQVKCRNWFYKISAIREVLPRLLIELSLFRCTRFIYGIEDIFTYMQLLIRRLNGISDPLAATYVKGFAVKQIFQVFGNFRFPCSPLLQSNSPRSNIKSNKSHPIKNMNIMNEVYLTLFRETLQMFEYMNDTFYRSIEVIVNGLMFSEDYLNLFRPMLDVMLICIVWNQPFATLQELETFLQKNVGSRLLDQVDLGTFLKRLQNSQDNNFLFCFNSKIVQHPMETSFPNADIKSDEHKKNVNQEFLEQNLD